MSGKKRGGGGGEAGNNHAMAGEGIDTEQNS